MKTVAISGYFDPLHVGHLEYIELAKELGDHLTVIVNNDFQWNKEQLPPKYMGWRILVIFVPIGYIKCIMDVPVREWD